MESLLGATALMGTLLLVPAVASAQTAPAATDANQEPTAVGETESAEEGQDAITVTGSRIRGRFTGADPVTTITRDDATAAGYSTTTDLLQSNAVTNGTAQINNAYGGFVTAGGPGANTLSLRGLGTSRTLILLNGRRMAPSGSRGAVGSADLNSLPNAMVERVEILNAGSSSIYGSDAIAGVVNVITRKGINGIELNAETTSPQVGAGVQKRVALMFGTKGERFSVDGSLEYYKRDGLTLGDRDFTRCSTGQRLNGTGGGMGSGDFIDPATGKPKCYGLANGTGDNGVTVNTIGLPTVKGNMVALGAGVPAGYTGDCNRFRPNPAVTTGAYPGYECVGGGTISLDVRDTFPKSILNNSLISGTENYNAYASAAYKLEALGDAEVYGEFLATRRNSSQTSNRQLSLDYNQGSLLLPAALRNLNFGNCAVASFPTCIAGTPIAARAFIDFGNYTNTQTSDFVKAGGGIRGNLPANFRYDAYASKSWSDSSYTTPVVLTDRLAQSLDVVASGSGFACRNTTGGCVAAPALSASVIGGTLPSDWRNYIAPEVTGTTKFRETTFAFNVDGPLFKLPGGDAQIAVGFEHRTQSIDDTPPNDSQRGNLLNTTSATATRGNDSVNEVYGELELPILRDTFVHDLTLTGSARYTDYRSYGSNTTWKVGGAFAPTKWLMFRGSYGTSFRAPQLFEQYLGATSGFQNAANDICGNLTTASNPNRVRNCAADGIGLGFTQNAGITVLQRGGAESGLTSETSTNLNLGGVLTPRFGDVQTSFSVDYYDLTVNNGVAQLGYATIMAQCYDSVEFRALAVCGLVKRNGTALQITTGYVNISKSYLQGLDYNARVSFPLAGGKMTLNGQVSHFLRRHSQQLPTDPIVDLIGKIINNSNAFPRFTGTFDATYAIDKFSVHYSAEWTDSTDTNAYYGAGPTYNFSTPDYWLHTISATYRTDQVRFTLGVRNLFDTEPPVTSSGAYNRVGSAPLYAGFDYVGRQFFASTAVRF
ncbi:TonB-dependent receptor [Sphingomonas sp. HITSZ_GF]|uniref:TonB-dependent receptor plug domain-containing protein n=1 Tax=Sphingomonas sp. HITSZ_GF TaxID=3037247 RepID=UPI00240E17D7|nr:TonB-dependent receptor [Sphingomonas sp. HITSZ_GF]MDG2534740.1 TonB-dependent receptor [Sphingomonas sp. HITSZ_GF]